MSDTCLGQIERYWQGLTVPANEFFNTGNFEKALSGYQDALFRAEVLNNNITRCIHLKIPFEKIYIISCNNLANTYEELGLIEKAENMLKRAIYYLLHLAGNRELKKGEIQSEIVRATVNYIRFAEKRNTGKVKQEEFIKSLKEQLLENKLLNID